MMRVEVETDLKLPMPPPMLPIPSRPPKEEEKDVNSTGKGQMNRKVEEMYSTVREKLTQSSLIFQ